MFTKRLPQISLPLTIAELLTQYEGYRYYPIVAIVLATADTVAYLQGQEDLVSILIAPISHITNPVMPIVDPVIPITDPITKSLTLQV